MKSWLQFGTRLKQPGVPDSKIILFLILNSGFSPLNSHKRLKVPMCVLQWKNSGIHEFMLKKNSFPGPLIQLSYPLPVLHHIVLLEQVSLMSEFAQIKAVLLFWRKGSPLNSEMGNL